MVGVGSLSDSSANLFCTNSADIIVSFSSPEIVTPENRGSVEICLTTSEVLSQPLTVVVLAQESVPADAGGMCNYSTYNLVIFCFCC